MDTCMEEQGRTKMERCACIAHHVDKARRGYLVLGEGRILGPWSAKRISERVSLTLRQISLSAGMPLFIVLCFTALCRYCISFLLFLLLLLFFYKLKVGVLSKSIGTIFQTAFAPFMFLCHILVIFTVFQTFQQQKVLHWRLT